MIAFILAHQVLLAGVVVGLMDLAIALHPGLEANGIFHAVYLFLKGKSQIAASPAA